MLFRSKCVFERSSVDYLGVIVGSGKVQMDPTKVAAVAEWKVPVNKKGVQEFLGFVNFYRRFIRDFSKIARPLHELTGKQPWRWEVEQQEAFDALKKCLCSEPILSIPKDDAPFRVEADCSQYAMGGVLSQLVDDKWHPVAYRSQSLSPVERNYEIHDRELLAIMRALEDWRPYLLGAMHPFEIWTDHQNLTYFKKAQKLNRRQARWHTELQEYNFTLVHKPGAQMKR